MTNVKCTVHLPIRLSDVVVVLVVIGVVVVGVVIVSVRFVILFKIVVVLILLIGDGSVTIFGKDT
jgi:hypothetical protein